VGQTLDALDEVMGGLVAPVADVVRQATLLGEEVCTAPLTIAGGQEPPELDLSVLLQP
jgi:hypothetical protein